MLLLCWPRIAVSWSPWLFERYEIDSVFLVLSERKAVTHLPLADLSWQLFLTLLLGLFVCSLSHFVLLLCMWGKLYLTNSKSEGRCRLQMFGSWLQFRCVCLDNGGPVPISSYFIRSQLWILQKCCKDTVECQFQSPSVVHILTFWRGLATNVLGIKADWKNCFEPAVASSSLFAIQATSLKLNSYSPSEPPPPQKKKKKKKKKKKNIESVTLTWDDSKEMQTKVKNDPENIEM